MEDYYQMIVMSTYCQQNRLIIDVNLVVTFRILLETEQMAGIWYQRSLNVWVHLSAYNNVIVIGQWTSHSQQETARVEEGNGKWCFYKPTNCCSKKQSVFESRYDQCPKQMSSRIYYHPHWLCKNINNNSHIVYTIISKGIRVHCHGQHNDLSARQMNSCRLYPVWSVSDRCHCQMSELEWFLQLQILVIKLLWMLLGTLIKSEISFRKWTLPIDPFQNSLQIMRLTNKHCYRNLWSIQWCDRTVPNAQKHI